MNEPLIGRRILTPFLREVPIWTYGPVYNVFGEYVQDGWSPQIYGHWTTNAPSSGASSADRSTHAEVPPEAQ